MLCPTLKAKPFSPRHEPFWIVYLGASFCRTSVGSGRTLRETVLESSPVLALLNQSFISSWSLVKELENMQVSCQDSKSSQLLKKKNLYNHIYFNHFQILIFSLKQADEQNPELSEKARLHLESYNFPVEMMVALPNGTIVNISIFYSFDSLPFMRLHKNPQIMCS